MAKTQVLNLKGEKVKDITLNDSVWNVEANESVMHDAIVLAQASLRQATMPPLRLKSDFPHCGQRSSVGLSQVIK